MLNHLYGFQCKIIRIDRGGDIVTKAREFAHHFETVGSPIMIGK